MYLLEATRVIISLGICALIFQLSGKRLKMLSLSFLFFTYYLSMKNSGFIGLAIFSVVTIGYLFWILLLNDGEQPGWKNAFRITTFIIASAYIAIQSFGLVMKIMLDKGLFQLLLKVNGILLGIFLIVSLVELMRAAKTARSRVEGS